MASKALAFMVGALVVLAVPTVLHYSSEKNAVRSDADVNAGELALPALSNMQAADVLALEISDRDGALRVERRGDTWVLPSKGGFPARAERVAEFVRGLQTLRLVEKSTANRDKHARVGLVAPADGGEESVLVRVLGADDAVVAELLLGKEELGRSSPATFVRRVDEDQAWLAYGDLVRTTTANTWFDNRLASVPSTRVKLASVIFDGRGDVGYELLREDPQNSGFSFRPLDEGRELVEEWKYTALARAFGSLSFDDVQPAAGFDTTGSERLDVTVATHDGLVLTLEARRLQSDVEGVSGPVWVSLGAGFEAPPAGPLAEGRTPPDPAAVEREVAELAARTNGWWFKVPASAATTLFTTREELLKPLPVLPALPEGGLDGAAIDGALDGAAIDGALDGAVEEPAEVPAGAPADPATDVPVEPVPVEPPPTDVPPADPSADPAGGGR
jgi:hypothetical protein